MDQQACEKKGWDWNERTKTCTRPKIGMIKVTITRGSPCGGSGKTRVIMRPGSLPASVRDALLKAAKSASRAARPGY